MPPCREKQRILDEKRALYERNHTILRTDPITGAEYRIKADSAQGRADNKAALRDVAARHASSVPQGQPPEMFTQEQVRESAWRCAAVDVHKAATSKTREGKKDHTLRSTYRGKREQYDDYGFVRRTMPAQRLDSYSQDTFATEYRKAVKWESKNQSARVELELTPEDHTARRNMGKKHEDNYQFKAIEGEAKQKNIPCIAEREADRQAHAEYLALRAECARIEAMNADRGKSYGGGSK